MGKTKDLSAFERGMVVDARRTGLCQQLQAAGFFHAQQLCIKNGPPPKGQLATSIGVNMETCRVHAKMESMP